MTTAKSREQIIHEHLATKKGRTKLVESMVGNMELRIAYMSLMPKMLNNDPELEGETRDLTTHQKYPRPDPTDMKATALAADRVLDQTVQDLKDQTDKYSLELFDLTPTNEPVVEGTYEYIILNARTWATMRKKGEMDPIPEDTLGGIPRYKGAQLIPSRNVEQDILIGVGPRERVGRYNWQLRLTDATEVKADQQRTPKTFGVKADLLLRVELEPNPQVKAHSYPSSG